MKIEKKDGNLLLCDDLLGYGRKQKVGLYKETELKIEGRSRRKNMEVVKKKQKEMGIYVKTEDEWFTFIKNT